MHLAARPVCDQYRQCVLVVVMYGPVSMEKDVAQLLQLKGRLLMRLPPMIFAEE